MYKGSCGFVIRDHLGHVAAAGVGPAAYQNAQHAEALACLKALEQAAPLEVQWPRLVCAMLEIVATLTIN